MYISTYMLKQTNPYDSMFAFLIFSILWGSAGRAEPFDVLAPAGEVRMLRGVNTCELAALLVVLEGGTCGAAKV